MNAQIILPSLKLRSIVLRYEFFEVGKSPRDHSGFLMLPGFDNGFIFLFYRNRPILLKNEVHNNTPVPSSNILPSVVLPAYNMQLEELSAIRVLFHPGVLSKIYDIDLKSFQNVLIEPWYALDKEIYFMQEQLSEVDDNKLRIDIIERYLLRKLQFKSMESLYFPALNNLFNQNGYRSSLESLANEFNLSLRQLNNHLNHEVGFPLSYFRRLHRFSKIIRHFKVSSIRSLTEVAYQFGYCDQAHFTREFKIMSTKTPRKYLKYIGQEKMLAPDLVDNFEFSNVMIDSCFNREK